MSNESEQATMRLGIFAGLLCVCAVCFMATTCNKQDNETVQKAVEHDKATLGRTWEGKPHVYMNTPPAEAKK